jgi:hypothetical protein
VPFSCLFDVSKVERVAMSSVHHMSTGKRKHMLWKSRAGIAAVMTYQAALHVLLLLVARALCCHTHAGAERMWHV